MTAATTAQLSRAALKGYIEKHLENAARPLSLAEVFRDVYPGQRATDCALLALRKRLQYLAAEGRLHSDGYGDGRTWSGITEAQRAEQAAQEAAQAAPVALPRRVRPLAALPRNTQGKLAYAELTTLCLQALPHSAPAAAIAEAEPLRWPPIREQLQQAGIALTQGYDAGQTAVQPDVFVIGNAISRGNPLLEAILDQGLPYVSGPQWLAENVLRGRWVLGVAGTHLLGVVDAGHAFDINTNQDAHALSFP